MCVCDLDEAVQRKGLLVTQCRCVCCRLWDGTGEQFLNIVLFTVSVVGLFAEQGMRCALRTVFAHSEVLNNLETESVSAGHISL